MSGDAYTTVSVLPEADTPMRARVQLVDGTPLASVEIGERGGFAAIIARDEETLVALAGVVERAREELVRMQVEAKQEEAEDERGQAVMPGTA